MINLIPQLSINGLGGQRGKTIFNGYIYSLNYSITKGDQGTSTITANIVSEDGTYSISPSDLQVATAYNINIGQSINTKMYLKKLRKKYSAQGNLLEIEFMDGSFILDRTFIGLHKKHGCNPDLTKDCPKMFGIKSPDWLIICGHEINDCDRNYDGITDLIKNIIDPCHPCQQDDININNKKLLDCKRDAKYKIYDVKYNFTELIKKLIKAGFKLKNANDPNPKFFQSYSGSLRSVLSSWCEKFGWIFFWDNGVIIFKDLRTIPTVNAQISSFCPNISDYEEEYTLDGTKQTALLTNYSRFGQDNTYTCQRAAYITIPVYTQDSAPPSSTLKITNKINETAAGLAYYSAELRNLYYWFDFYGFRHPEDYETGARLNNLGVTILTSAIQLYPGSSSESTELQLNSLEPSSNLTDINYPDIRDSLDGEAPSPIDTRFLDADVSFDPILQKTQEDILDNEEFLTCFQMMDPETQWKVAKNIKDYFFFVAHHDDVVNNRFLQQEREYAEEFLGKYHIYMPNLSDDNSRQFFQDFTFYIDTTCGNSVLQNAGDINYSFLGKPNGDSEPIYHNNLGLDANGDLQTLSNLPFSKYLSIMRDSASTGTVGDSLANFKLIVVENNRQRFFPAPTMGNSDAEEGNPPEFAVQDATKINQAFSYMPKPIRNFYNGNGENVLRLILGKDFAKKNPTLDQNKINIYLGYRVKDGDFKLTTTQGLNPAGLNDPSDGKGSGNPLVQVGLPFHGEPLNHDIDPITHKLQEKLIYKYPELLCKRVGYQNNYCFIKNFKTPAGVFNYYLPSYSDYSVIMEQTRTVRKRIDKYESINITGPKNLSNTVSNFDVKTLSISDNDITTFNKLAPNTCIFSDEKIKQYHDEYAKNLILDQTTPLIKKSFTIEGVDINNPSLATLENGLQGINISVDDNGVHSTYTFGTSHMLSPDPDVYSKVNSSAINNLQGKNFQSTPLSLVSPDPVPNTQQGGSAFSF